jgi:uncharacterized BrkB/YihY/UPF0761 family membrane protein
MSDDIFPSLVQFLYIIPALLVCLIGVLVLSMRAMPKKARIAGISGLIITMFLSIAGVCFSLYMQHAVVAASYSSESFRFTQIAYGVFATLMHVLALALLIAAICIRDTPTPVKSDGKNPYELP